MLSLTAVILYGRFILLIKCYLKALVIAFDLSSWCFRSVRLKFSEAIKDPQTHDYFVAHLSTALLPPNTIENSKQEISQFTEISDLACEEKLCYESYNFDRTRQ